MCAAIIAMQSSLPHQNETRMLRSLLSRGPRQQVSSRTQDRCSNSVATVSEHDCLNHWPVKIIQIGKGLIVNESVLISVNFYVQTEFCMSFNRSLVAIRIITCVRRNSVCHSTDLLLPFVSSLVSDGILYVIQPISCCHSYHHLCQTEFCMSFNRSLVAIRTSLVSDLSFVTVRAIAGHH